MSESKGIVRRFFPIACYEIAAIEEYLSGMARKGFFVIHRKGFFWYFKKGTPKNITYYVDIFDGASWFDTRAEGKTLDYMEYCRSAGWNYIFTDGKYQFFCTEKEEPVAIETDQKQRLKMINKASISRRVILPVIWMVYGILFVSMFVGRFKYNKDAWLDFTYLDIDVIAVWTVLGLIGFMTFINYIIFYLRNRIRLKQGKPFVAGTLRQVKRKVTIYYISLGLVLVLNAAIAFMSSIRFGLVILLIIALVISISFLVSAIFGKNREKHSRSYNKTVIVVSSLGGLAASMVIASLIIFSVIAMSMNRHSKSVIYKDKDGNEVTWIIGADKIPFTLEDAGYRISEKGYRDTSEYTQKSIFYTDKSYSDSFYLGPDSDAEYAIYYDKYTFGNSYFFEKWMNKYLSDKSYTVTKLDDLKQQWKAKEVCLLKAKDVKEDSDQVLVVYDRKCYLLSANLQNQSQLQKVLD